MNLEMFNKLNNILQPHFCLVDNPDNDKPIFNFEEIYNRHILFWKLKSVNKKLICTKKQNELLEMVKQLNFGEANLYYLNGMGKYLILEQF
jgi:hypothetical protein